MVVQSLLVLLVLSSTRTWSARLGNLESFSSGLSGFLSIKTSGSLFSIKWVAGYLNLGIFYFSVCNLALRIIGLTGLMFLQVKTKLLLLMPSRRWRQAKSAHNRRKRRLRSLNNWLRSSRVPYMY